MEIVLLTSPEYFEPTKSKLQTHNKGLIINQIVSLDDTLSNNTLIFIDANTNFQKKYGVKEGFELAQQIRLKLKNGNPIVFYSFYKKTHFEKLSLTDPAYKLIYGSGSYYLELPFDKEALETVLESARPISSSELIDVSMMLCNLQGIISDRLNHDLSYTADIALIFNKVLPYLTTEQIVELGLNEFQNKLIDFQKKGNEHAFIEQKTLLRSKLNYYFETKNSKEVVDFGMHGNKKHKIILLEDNTLLLDNLTTELSNIFEVLPFRFSSQALLAIQNDERNQIVAVISDWRLYKDETNSYWQDLQGYVFLEEVSKLGIRALFSLTSQDDGLIHKIRNASDSKYQIYKKENLVGKAALSVFADTIFNQCEEINLTISNLPISKTWEKLIDGKSYQMLYRSFRNSEIDKFKKIEISSDSIFEKLNDYIEIGMHDATPVISKTVYEEALINLLIARRIYFSLKTKGIDDKEIHKIMYLDGSKTKVDVYDTNITQLLSKLCLTKKDYQEKRFLPEELNWLKKHKLISN